MNKKPNIILYLTDDLGYGDVSCLNEGSKVNTKNIDRMAADGICFTDAHSSSSVCTPSRYSLMTGRYNWRSKLKSSVLPGCAPPLLEEGRMTLGSMLQSAGYRTAAVGKWHLGMNWATEDGWKLPETLQELFACDEYHIDFDKPIENGPTTKGFDYYYGMCGSLDQPPFAIIENDRICTQKPDRHIGKRGFMPSKPGACTPEDYDYGPISPDFDFQKAVPMMHDKILDLVDDYAKEDDPFFIYAPSLAVHGPLVPAEEFVGKSGIGPYGDFILQVDDFMGVLNQKLEYLGIADNTIVIFTSDNGCAPIIDIPNLASTTGHNPSYIFRGMKFDIWEGGHRVPFIAKWPDGIAAGQRSDQLVCLTDVFATLADIIDVPYGDDTAEDSVSILPLLKGDDYPVREALVHHSGFGMYSMRSGKWKLDLCPGSGGFSYPSEQRDEVADLTPMQLYDISQDPGEQNNLFESHCDVVRTLRDRLASYIISGRSTPGAEQPNYHYSAAWPGLDWMNL